VRPLLILTSVLAVLALLAVPASASTDIQIDPEMGREFKAYLGEDVNFNATVPEGSMVQWDFGDDSTADGSEVTHAFQETGTYTVTLTVDGTVQEQFTVKVTRSPGIYLAALGAGLAIGIAGMGAGIGVGIVGAAGAGTIAEKPDKFNKCFIFQALPQTQAIYGFLIAILILLGSGLLGGSEEYVPVSIGLAAVGAGLAVGVAGLSAIGQGIAASSGIGAVAEKDEMFGKGMIFSVLPETQAIYGLLIAIFILTNSGIFSGSFPGFMYGKMGFGLGLVAVGAGLAVGIAGLSAIGQGIAASSGVGVVAEKNELFGRAMIFSVLPETQAIYGLLVAILLMVFTGFLMGTVELTDNVIGFAALGAGLAIGIAGLSAIGQGITSGASIGAVSRRQDVFGRCMIFSVMSETFAIFGLLIAIFIMLYSGIM